MGLMFDDDNTVVCPNCGSHFFIEVVEYTLDESFDGFENFYIETGRRYTIRCADCNRVIDFDNKPKITKQTS